MCAQYFKNKEQSEINLWDSKVNSKLKVHYHMAKLKVQLHQRNGHIPNLKLAENGRKW